MGHPNLAEVELDKTMTAHVPPQQQPYEPTAGSHPLFWFIICGWFMGYERPQDFFLGALKPVWNDVVDTPPIVFAISAGILCLSVVIFVRFLLFLINTKTSIQWEKRHSKIIFHLMIWCFVAEFLYHESYLALGTRSSYLFNIPYIKTLASDLEMRLPFLYIALRYTLFFLNMGLHIGLSYFWIISAVCLFRGATNPVGNFNPNLTASPFENIVESQRAQLEIRTFKQNVIVVAMAAAAVLSIFFFNQMFKQSYVARVEYTLSGVTENRVLQVINDYPADYRLSRLRSDLLYSLNDLRGRIDRGDKKGLSERIDQAIEIIRQNGTTVTNAIDSSPDRYRQDIKSLTQAVEKASERLREIPRVDWEAIFVRMSALVVTLFVIKILHTTLLRFKEEAETIRREMLATEYVAKLDKETLLSVGSLITSMNNTTSKSSGDVPPLPPELLEAAKLLKAAAGK